MKFKKKHQSNGLVVSKDQKTPTRNSQFLDTINFPTFPTIIQLFNLLWGT